MSTLELCLTVPSLCCLSLLKALLSGSDKRPGQHRSQPAGGATGGRADGEPFRAVCPTGPGRKESQ